MEERDYLVFFKSEPPHVMTASISSGTDLVEFFQRAFDIISEHRPFGRRRVVVDVRLLVAKESYVLDKKRPIIVPAKVRTPIEADTASDDAEEERQGLMARVSKLIRETSHHSLFHLVVTLMTILVIAKLNSGTH